VAAWLSEKVLRGRGPDASGFESHRRGRIFSKERTSAGPWVCVCLSGADGRVGERRATLFRHHREVSRVQIPGRMGPSHGCLCCISCCVVQKERVGVGGRGKYLGAPPHIKGKRKRGRNKPTARYGEKGKANKKTKKSTHNIKTVRNVCLQLPNIMLLSSLFVLNV
jgi:hypothetical protein